MFDYIYHEETYYVDGSQNFIRDWIEYSVSREEALKILRKEGARYLEVVHIGGNNRCDYIADRSVYENGILRMLSSGKEEDDLPF